MTTLIVIHEVEDGERWARAWEHAPGSRHEMFGEIGVTARTFRDPDHPELTGLVLEVPDLDGFDSFMASPEAEQAMEKDGLKVETMRILREFTP